MSRKEATIRPLRREDFDAVVEIDRRVSGKARPEYYELKFGRALDAKDHMTLSFVAETEGKVVGFVMGDLYVGEYGIPSTAATLDTLGVHPEHRGTGVSRLLMGEFVGHLRKAGVEKVNTLVQWNDWQLIRFFSSQGFEPARTINLERIL